MADNEWVGWVIFTCLMMVFPGIAVMTAVLERQIKAKRKRKAGADA